MSHYDDDRRSHRGKTRERMPAYVDTEDTYVGRAPTNRDLVLRPRDRDDYYDDDRYSDYHGGGGGSHRRARSVGHRDRYYDDDYYSDYDSRHDRGRRSSRYGDDDDGYSYRSGGDGKRSKSKIREAAEGFGLGSILAAVKSKSRSKSRHRRGSDGSDRSSYSRGGRSKSRDNKKKFQQAAFAALAAGGAEFINSRKVPGGLAGEKGQRILTTALSAAGVNGLLDRDPNKKAKRHVIESVIGGLVTNRLANGSSRAASRAGSRGRSASRSNSMVGRLRSRSRSIFGGGRSPSRGRSSSREGGGGERGRSKSATGLKGLAAAGGAAAVGKLIWDRVRSKSRGRLDRDRSRSVGSEDSSYVPSRRQRYGQKGSQDQQGQRGLGNGALGGGPSRGQYDGRSEDDHEISRGRSAEKNTGSTGEGDDRNRSRSHSTSTISSTDLEKQHKKTRTKELVTAGLATVATIHAAHGVYSSMMASEKRRKLVREGEMSPEEARKRKSKNMLQDAAAVGIAALGLKSAFGEWKEMNESRKEKHELEARRARHLKNRERRQKELQDRVADLQQHPTRPPGQRGDDYNDRDDRDDRRYGQGSGYPAQSNAPGYGDANPYGAYGGAHQGYASSLPPPPHGGPPR
jgi:hypothetical protein